MGEPYATAFMTAQIHHCASAFGRDRPECSWLLLVGAVAMVLLIDGGGSQVAEGSEAIAL